MKLSISVSDEDYRTLQSINRSPSKAVQHVIQTYRVVAEEIEKDRQWVNQFCGV